MRNIIKRVGAFTMGLAVSVSLMGGALAYTTPDFTDVPAANWAYEPVMKMADAGIIKGSSSTTFSPEVKVSPAMWLTLVGRAVYEADVKAAAQAGDIWYSAYVRVAETKGLLTGTAIDKNDIEGEMTRYDMAATVYAAIKLLGVKDATVDTAAIKDYGDIPQKYLAAVGQMYATGLIKGDGAGNFNGTATMTRAEAATVMDRLTTLKANLETSPTEPEKPTEPEIPPRTGEMVTVEFDGIVRTVGSMNETTPPPNGAIVILRFKDGRELGRTETNTKGEYHMVATMDKADYSLSEYWYYTEAYYTDPEGNKFSSVYKNGSHLLNTNFYEASKVGWKGLLVMNSENYVTDF